MNPPKVVLNMIVKNEGTIIAETLKHVRPFIDAYAIMDTGSTDNTISEIERALEGLPGRVASMEWDGFANCRNAAIDLAEGLGDYLLFLDADDKFVITGSIPHIKSQMSKSLHPCNILHGSINYERMVIRSLKSTSRYRFVLHEVLMNTAEDSIGERLEGFHIVHNAIGTSDRNNQSSKSKYNRDAQVIEREIANGVEPQDLPRYQFYLAQSYRDSEDPEKALDAYKKRLEMKNGWSQERYVSAIESGKLYARGLGSRGDQLFAYHQAIEIDPTRAEAHFHIAEIARQEHLWNLAYQHAHIARSLKNPAHALFSHWEIYQWKATFEVSVAAFYTGAFEEGLTACEELLLHPDVPESFKKTTADNKKFYKQSLVLQ
jgi:glycosyltransferase involved in cell wall biosynthesis